MSSTAPIKVWIFRKGNGQLRVHPSPGVFGRGELFRIKNLAATEAMASFPLEVVKEGRVTIPSGGTSEDLMIVAERSRYFEYDVTAGGDYAEGGSKPAGIVDP